MYWFTVFSEFALIFAVLGIFINYFLQYYSSECKTKGFVLII